MSYSYLKTFFEEKNLDERVYTVSSKNGTQNLLCTSDVVQALYDAGGNVQAKAAEILRVIDHANGDPHNFLEHMAGGLAVDLEDL